MISKERLEELIEQKKQVWKIYKDTCQGAYQVPAGLFGIGFSSQVDETTPFNELFETKEEADWYKEFGCIERVERLELPTWEEFDEKKFIWFVDKNQNQCCLYYLNVSNKIFINISGEVIEIGELTKENYFLACRKAKELFLGEKNNS